MFRDSLDKILSYKNLLRLALAWAVLFGAFIACRSWNRMNLVHEMNAHGIEAFAQVDRLRVWRWNSPVYTLDVSWWLKSGAEGRASVTPSAAYAKELIAEGNSPYAAPELRVSAVRIKYLEADPSNVILYLDPMQAEETLAGWAKAGAALTAAGMAGILLWVLTVRVWGSYGRSAPHRPGQARK